MPYRGPEAPPTARDEAVAHGPQQDAGRRVGGQLGQELVDGAEADDEVVAVIPVAEHGVQPGQVRAVALDDPTAAGERGADRRARR